MAKMDEVRKTIETSLGNLNTTRAQEIAKGMLDKDTAKDQVAKTAADLMERSQRYGNKLVDLIRSEIRDQLRQMGVATQDELNALRKRVRELERASRATGARGKKPTAKAKAAPRKPAAAKTTPKQADTTQA